MDEEPYFESYRYDPSMMNERIFFVVVSFGMREICSQLSECVCVLIVVLFDISGPINITPIPHISSHFVSPQ